MHMMILYDKILFLQVTFGGQMGVNEAYTCMKVAYNNGCSFLTMLRFTISGKQKRSWVKYSNACLKKMLFDELT